MRAEDDVIQVVMTGVIADALEDMLVLRGAKLVHTPHLEQPGDLPTYIIGINTEPSTTLARLSIPGLLCSHCGTEMGLSMVCPGCDWCDPKTCTPEQWAEKNDPS